MAFARPIIAPPGFAAKVKVDAKGDRVMQKSPGREAALGGYPLVLVEWLDSCGAIARWQYLDESEPELVLCRSVGWLVYDGEDCKRLVPHIGHHDGPDARNQGCGDMTIPSSAITEIKDLRIATSPRKP